MGKNTIKLVNEARWTDGLVVSNRLNDITYEPMRSQEDFIMRLVRENSKTVYGKFMGFSRISNLQDFRQRVPLTTYDDYSDYIERIAKGEKNILTAYLTEHFSLLSGYKKLPVSRWDAQMAYDYQFCSCFYVAGCHGLLSDGMTLNLVDNNMERLSTKATVGNLLGRLLVRRKFDSKDIYVLPVDATSQTENEDTDYQQALLALSQKDVSMAMCEHFSYMLNLLRYIEKHWPRLAYDIEHGTALLQPNPERANEIREIMEGHHIGTQMVEQLWPGLHCMMIYDVNSLNASFELLRTYCGKNIHFMFTGISTPEGTFSTTLYLDDPQTVLIPDSVFYEFKPTETDDYRHLLTLDQLEIGRSYELVVTTLSGLYRYKTYKTFTVVGRYHDTPTVICQS